MNIETERVERVARVSAKTREKNRRDGIPDMEIGDRHDNETPSDDNALVASRLRTLLQSIVSRNENGVWFAKMDGRFYQMPWYMCQEFELHRKLIEDKP